MDSFGYARLTVPTDPSVRLRILLVDDDFMTLSMVRRLLGLCSYQVTSCQRATMALDILGSNSGGFDLVITDVYMPEMDGFKLTEAIVDDRRSLNMPIIMMSSDSGHQTMMRGLQMGACYYMVKPLRIEGLKNIWQHVVKKRIEQPWNSLSCIGGTNPLCEYSKKMAVEDSSDDDDDESTIDRHSKSRKRHRDDNESSDVGEEKRRMVWHPELHAKFLSAVNVLGFNKAVPKTILRLMKVPGLRREHIASHLQKYRMHLKRRAEAMQNEPCNTNRSYAEHYVPASTQSASNLQYGASLAQLAGSKSFLGALQPTLHGGGPSSSSSSSSNTNFRPSNAAPRLATFLQAAAYSGTSEMGGPTSIATSQNPRKPFDDFNSASMEGSSTPGLDEFLGLIESTRASESKPEDLGLSFNDTSIQTQFDLDELFSKEPSMLNRGDDELRIDVSDYQLDIDPSAK